MRHFITSFLALASVASYCFPAYAGAALTIGDVEVSPSEGALYANDENRITNLSYVINLTNSGDIDLNPGDEGFSVTLVHSSGTDLQTIDVTTPIAAGESALVTFNWDFSVDPIVKEDEPKVWSRLNVRENVSSTQKNILPWRDIYKSSVNFALVGESSNTEISETLNFGFVTEPTTMDLRIRATGTKDLTVSSIDTPEGFSVEPATPFTIPGLATATTSGDCFKTIKLTFSPTTSGVKAGNIRINVEGAESKEYAVSGAYVGENSFYEGFDGEGGDEYEPKGWVLSSHWSLKWKNTSETDHYVLAHGSADMPNFDFAISPKLRFNGTEAMTFETAKRGNDSRLEVYYSPDRLNWTILKTITVNGDEGSEKFPATREALDSYVLSGIPEGEWYIGFKGLYVFLNNVFGGEAVSVEHDAIITGSEFPSKSTVNVPYTASVTVKNLTENTEAADAYTVRLMSGDKVLAEAETTELASLSEQTFGLSYTPHEPGEVELRIAVSLYGIELSTVPVTVTVNPESSSDIVQVGTVTGSNSNIPLRTNYYNSESQSIYTEDYLAKYGITPGTKITGLTYDAKSSYQQDINTKLTIWMQKTEDTTIEPGNPYDLSEVTPVFCDESYIMSIVISNEYYELINATFASGFVYEGGNLLISVRSEADSWKGCDFEIDSELKNNTIYHYNDDNSKFLTSTWYLQTGVPVVKFMVYSEPATLQGTVTDSNGNPVANTEVRLSAGEVIYTATTDESGAYSMEIFQAGLTYTLTVDNSSYPFYTKEVSFADGNADGNIVLPEFSTEREYELTVKVTSSTDESLEGKPFTLVSDRFSVTYPASETVLDAAGTATLNVYGGQHTITVSHPGMKPVTETFSINKASSIELAITEDVRTPFGVSVDVVHDIFTGANNTTLVWNRDEVKFHDSFEDMEPFTIDPTPWSGIDGDNSAPIVMQGSYDNAGSLCYAQIINPMAVDPIWDPISYPTLTAKDGMQYAGFPDLANGKDHDDWLITPSITLGDENVLRFSIKSADKTEARFTVGITTAGNPTASDFAIISEGNYISAGYENWNTVEIPLSAYAGQTVKIGFHCISSYGAFISQLDDVFVGRPGSQGQGKAMRVASRSAANPNEKFVIKLDGETVGETTGYEFDLGDVLPGEHTATVVATYLNAEAAPVDVNFTINADDYVKTDIAVTTNNGIIPESMTVTLAESEGGNSYTIPLSDGSASVASLPKGRYDLNLEQAFFDPYSATVDIASESTIEISLKETITAPFNVVHEEVSSEDGLVDVMVTWNRNLGFADSFEEYSDFSTGNFGGWSTADHNSEPSYPIRLGANIVTFPGSSTPNAPVPVPPMVFNPYTTSPTMAQDAAILAPDGIKTIIFQGPQNAKADKWLISPKLTIREAYELSLVAKAYTIYPETLEFCISTSGTDKENFTVLDAIKPNNEWTLYTLSLAEYEGQEVYLAVHCVSYDGFIVQIDNFKVGRKGGEETIAAGYVQEFDITHNDEPVGSTTDTEITLTGLSDGTHTVGIRAKYASGYSGTTVYEFELSGHEVSGAMSADAATAISVRGGKGEITVTGGNGTEVTVVNTLGVVIARVVANGTVSIPADNGVYVVVADGIGSKVVVR